MRFDYALRSSSMRFVYALCLLRPSAANAIALAAIEELLPKIRTQSISLEIEREYNNQPPEEGRDEYGRPLQHGNLYSAGVAIRTRWAWQFILRWQFELAGVSIRTWQAWKFILGGRVNSFSDGNSYSAGVAIRTRMAIRTRRAWGVAIHTRRAW